MNSSESVETYARVKGGQIPRAVPYTNSDKERRTFETKVLFRTKSWKPSWFSHLLMKPVQHHKWLLVMHVSNMLCEIEPIEKLSVSIKISMGDNALHLECTWWDEETPTTGIFQVNEAENDLIEILPLGRNQCEYPRSAAEYEVVLMKNMTIACLTQHIRGIPQRWLLRGRLHWMKDGDSRTKLISGYFIQVFCELSTSKTAFLTIYTCSPSGAIYLIFINGRNASRRPRLVSLS